MNYKYENNTIKLYDAESFHIEQILECGQCFRFYKIKENNYRIIAMGRILYIEQMGNNITFYPCTEEDFKNIWIKYLDLDTDYNDMKVILSKDTILDKAINHAPGIRILNQETWECLISFIISQNNRIPRIKQIIENISTKYGDLIEGDLYAFPTVEQLSKATEEDLKLCKSGFRAKYIVDACHIVNTGTLVLESFDGMTTLELREKLMQIKGVGPKVSDCVLLFSQNRKEVFPTDVWIIKVMQHFYFEREVSIKEIHQYAYDNFGDKAGIAQQYLFYYAMANNEFFPNKK